MLRDEIRKELFRLQDVGYRDFQSKLIPNVDPGKMIGVRTPALRKYAKELVRREDIDDFLADLPHEYFDEDQLHAFIISEIKSFDRCMAMTEEFLPYINNCKDIACTDGQKR